MKLRHFLQPLEGQAGRVLMEAIQACSSPVEVVAIVAWLKLSGLRRMDPTFRAVIDAGGSVRVIVGIDQRGTSREALTLALNIGVELSVYHDQPGPGSIVGRTFHPKLYAVRDARRVLFLVGSGNFTAGGLFTNYEWFERLELDSTLAADRQFAAELDTSLTRLLSEPSTSKRITNQAALADLLRTDGVLIPSERQTSRERQVRGVRRTSAFGGRLGLPMAPQLAAEVEDPDLPLSEQLRRRQRVRQRKPPSVGALRRSIQEIGRGRPGQIQLRKQVAEWIFRDRRQITFERALDQTRRTRPVVTTHARGQENTVRIELEGFDQNRARSLVVLEQQGDNSIRWEFYPISARAAEPFVEVLPRRRRSMPAVLQQLNDDGEWETVESLT